MSDTEKDAERDDRVERAKAARSAITKTPNANILVTAEHLHREQLADEMVHLAANPINETVPGGKYIGEDGEAHDAEGRRLDENDEPIQPADTSAADAVTIARAKAKAKKTARR